MDRAQRIRLARRRSGLSQSVLARHIGVRRSAVANWEAASGANPSSGNLERLACVLQVAHEWLATGRGEMMLPGHWHDVPAADAELVENTLERRLLQAWRALPTKPGLALLEFVEAYDRRRKCPMTPRRPHNR